MGFKIKKSITYDMMDDSRVEYEFDNTNDLNHIIFKGDCREPFSFSRVLVEELIKTFETIRDRYSDNYELKVYLYNCIIQLSVNPKDPSESFFDVYDRDEMKLIYGIKISILDQARKAMVKAGNNATKILVKTFRGKLFKKAFERARRGKDISSFERQEKESGFNFLHNPNNGRMQSGHIIIDGIGLFKQIIHER